MKKIILIALFFVACNKPTDTKKKVYLTDKPNMVEVLDFYGKRRCVTCIDIERNTKYVVNTLLKDYVVKNKLVFKTIDVSDSKNTQIADVYQAVGTALFLNIIKDGKETHVDLTDFSFLKGSKDAIFQQELKEKIENALKDI